MSSVDETVANVQRKIDRERALINAANAMRQSTNNPAVLSRLDGQIKDGRRNIEYFESKLRDLSVQRTAAGVENMSLQQPGGSGIRPKTAGMATCRTSREATAGSRASVAAQGSCHRAPHMPRQHLARRTRGPTTASWVRALPIRYGLHTDA
jgi:hypothetical protein